MKASALQLLTVAVNDLPAALKTFQKNFDFPVQAREETNIGESAARLGVGPHTIELRATASKESPIAEHLALRGEGLFRMQLVVDDLSAAYKELEAAGIEAHLDTRADGSLVLLVGPRGTNGVPLMFVTGA